jgi:hypothetical protein
VTFFNEYAVRGPDGQIPPWFQFDFGKPNISLAHAQRQDHVPVKAQAWLDADKERVLVQMTFDDAAVTDAGAPAQAWFEFFEGQNGDLRLQVYSPPHASPPPSPPRQPPLMSAFRFTSSTKPPLVCLNLSSSPPASSFPPAATGTSRSWVEALRRKTLCSTAAATRTACRLMAVCTWLRLHVRRSFV